MIELNIEELGILVKARDVLYAKGAPTVASGVEGVLHNSYLEVSDDEMKDAAK